MADDGVPCCLLKFPASNLHTTTFLKPLSQIQHRRANKPTVIQPLPPPISLYEPHTPIKHHDKAALPSISQANVASRGHLKMQCDLCGICDRHFDRTRKPLCVSCAQTTLYEPRVRQVIGRLDRENAHTHTEAIVRPGNDGVLAALPQDADWDAITNAVKKHSSGRARAEQTRVETRIDVIAEQADILRQQVEDHKKYIEDLKRKNVTRRQEISSERQELAKRKPLALGPVQLAKQKAAQRLDRIHGRTVDARSYICRHSSSMNGVHQLRDARGKHIGRYELNGLTIPNLKDFNSAVQGVHQSDKDSTGESHIHINACLDNVCHLLGVWCHYLSVRLPAEIILPHSDFPHPAILPEKSSYKATGLAYPGVLAKHSSSPSASRILQDQRELPRPRLLQLDRPLAQLAKQDPKAFGLFVEGAMLLAWDLAWLCRTQGITTINSFDDVCDIGRNVWLLSLAQQNSVSDRDRRDKGASEGGSRTRKPTVESLRFGSFSHGNLRHCLSSHEGLAVMQEWRLSQPHRLIDKLRNHLLIEITGAEWDVVDDDDFEDEGDDELAVLVSGSHRNTPEDRHPVMSVMSIATHGDTNPRQKGGNGWTKVRGRSEDV